MPPDVNVADELDLDFGASEPAAGGLSEPAARRRGSKGEQTRAVTVEAAPRLFRENGYEATTMRASAKEAVLRSLTRRLLSVLDEVLG